LTPTPAPPTSTALVVVAAAIACEERGLGLSRYQVLEVAKQDWRDGERSIPSLISIENFKIHEPKNGNRQPAGGPVEASSLQGPPGTHAGTAARVTFDQER
tara:strand:+ start:196 stop:498 length:303 start_codon:yes stop_codon:yes gene_type:complete